MEKGFKDNQRLFFLMIRNLGKKKQPRLGIVQDKEDEFISQEKKVNGKLEAAFPSSNVYI